MRLIHPSVAVWQLRVVAIIVFAVSCFTTASVVSRADELTGKEDSADASPSGQSSTTPERGILHRIGIGNLQHRGAVRAVSFLDTPKRLASFGTDGALCTWDIRSGAKIDAFSVTPDASMDISVATISSNGSRLAFGIRQGHAEVWSIQHKKKLLHVPALDPEILAFSRDGRFLASVNRGQELHVLDIDKGGTPKLLRSKRDPSATRTAGTDLVDIAFTGSGRHVIGLSQFGYVSMWATDGKLPETEMGRWGASGLRSNGLAVSTNGESAAVTTDGGLSTWNLPVSHIQGSLKGLTTGGGRPRLYPLTYSLDGRKLLVRPARSTEMWVVDADLKGEIRRIQLPIEASELERGRVCAALSRSGEYIALACGTGLVRLWRVSDQVELFASPERHEGAVRSVVFAENATSVVTATGGDSVLRVWDPESGRLRRRLVLDCKGIYSIAADAEQNVLAIGSTDSNVLLLNLSNSRVVRRYRGHREWISSVGVSPDGSKLAAASFGGKVLAWDSRTGEIVAEFDLPHRQPVRTLDFSRNGRFLVAASQDASIPIWNVEEETLHTQLSSRTGLVFCAAFLGDSGAVVSGHSDGTLRIWNFRNAQQLFELPSAGSQVLSLAVSPDQQLVACGDSKGRVRLLELASGELIATLNSHSKGVTSLAFSPSCRILVSGSGDRSAIVWNLADISLYGDNGAVVNPPERDCEQLWSTLASTDPRQAQQAIWAMVEMADPAVAYLSRRIRPFDEDMFDELCSALDHREFGVRQRAARDLQNLSIESMDRLRRLHLKTDSTEVKASLEIIMRVLGDPRATSTDETRIRRALSILHRIDSRRACDALRLIAAGIPDAMRTQLARTALSLTKQDYQVIEGHK